MSDQTAPLTDEERAELEQLRAEKAARLEAEQARQERAELERLRAESAEARGQVRASQTSVQGTAEDERVRAARERGRKLMEPGDDLSMPTGQKIVLVAIALIVVAVIATIVFGPK